MMPTTAVVDHEVTAVTITTSAEPSDDLSSYELLKDIPEWADPSVSLHELDFLFSCHNTQIPWSYEV